MCIRDRSWTAQTRGANIPLPLGSLHYIWTFTLFYFASAEIYDVVKTSSDLWGAEVTVIGSVCATAVTLVAAAWHYMKKGTTTKTYTRVPLDED